MVFGSVSQTHDTEQTARRYDELGSWFTGKSHKTRRKSDDTANTYCGGIFKRWQGWTLKSSYGYMVRHQYDKQPEKVNLRFCNAGMMLRVHLTAALPSRPFSVSRGDEICFAPAFILSCRPALQEESCISRLPID